MKTSKDLVKKLSSVSVNLLESSLLHDNVKKYHQDRSSDETREELIYTIDSLIKYLATLKDPTEISETRYRLDKSYASLAIFDLRR
jgi:hypothetical protein